MRDLTEALQLAPQSAELQKVGQRLLKVAETKAGTPFSNDSNPGGSAACDATRLAASANMSTKALGDRSRRVFRTRMEN